MKLIKFSKNILSIILALSLVFIATACSGQTGNTSPSGVPASPTASDSAKPSASASSGVKIDNSSARITAMTQEYIGDNIAEILMISYDGGQPGLEQYGGKNPEIEAFNNTIKFGIQQTYNDFRDTADDVSWIEIRSYPFTGENYLQIVTTCCTYPSYGTDGDLYSYNFDLKENRFMSVDDVLEQLQLDRARVAEDVRSLVEDGYDDGTTVDDVNIAGFLIVQGPSGPVTQLLLQVNIEYPGADTWDSFFGYTPELGELAALNSYCLFDPYDMDQMDPPLTYQMEPEQDYPVLSFDTTGLEVLTPDYEYSYDGMIYFSIEELSPAPYGEDAVLEQIENLEPYTINITTLTESAEHKNLLNWPCWLVVYDEGENEDTRQCTDVYVQTDTADFRVHTSVSADFAQDYHDEIGLRLATLYWAE